MTRRWNPSGRRGNQTREDLVDLSAELGDAGINFMKSFHNILNDFLVLSH